MGIEVALNGNVASLIVDDTAQTALNDGLLVFADNSDVASDAQRAQQLSIASEQAQFSVRSMRVRRVPQSTGEVAPIQDGPSTTAVWVWWWWPPIVGAVLLCCFAALIAMCLLR